MSIDRIIYLGKSRRKIIEVQFSMVAPEQLTKNNWKVYVSIEGFPDAFNRSLTPALEVHEKEKVEEKPSYPKIEKTFEECS